MKNLFMCACLLIGTQAFASNNGKAVAPDHGAAVIARATALTRTMAQTVQLDEGQYLKIKQLNTRMLTAVDDLKARFSADPELLDQHMAEAQFRYEMELTALLRPRQIAVYHAARENMTALSITR
jgi:hypothetical protein